MLCEDCKKRSATVHVTKIINNEKAERHLCEECAAKEHQINFSFKPDFSIHHLLTNLLNYDQGLGNINYQPQQLQSCSNCGLNYEQFVHQGKMGCAKCYSTFSRRIDSLLKRVHGNANHVGKIPKRSGENFRLQRELLSLRRQLEEHIRREEFEAAAEVRDKIKSMESVINGGDSL